MFNKRLLQEFKTSRNDVVYMALSQWVMLIANIIFYFSTAYFLFGIVNQTIANTFIWYYLGIVMTVIILRNGMQFIYHKYSFKIAFKVKQSLRNSIFSKLMKISSQYTKYIQTSRLVQISCEGVEQLEIYFSKYLPQFIYSMLAPITLFMVVAFINIKIAIILFICVPLIPISIMAVQTFAKKLLQKYWGKYTSLGDVFLENLRGLTTLKIYNADSRYQEKMETEFENFRKITMRVLIMQLNSISVMDLVAYGGTALGIIFTIIELQAGTIHLGEAFFIIMISAEFFLPMRLLGSFFHIAMNGNAAANTIFSFLDTIMIEEKDTTEINNGDIVIKELSFSYDQEDVLQNINCILPKHSFSAIVGKSGCGKSTLSSLLMGQYDHYRGSLTLDTKELNGLNRDALLKKITCVSHDSYMFEGTIKENLRFAKSDATNQQLEEVLAKVELLETINKKGGLDMLLKENASNLSGGQKQRLALARALLHNSDIYIFDEATSNIDSESEDKIMTVIHQLAKTKTVIVISHRLSNIVDASQIFFMQDGQIVESGTHQQLMNNKQDYSMLYQSQQTLENYIKKEVHHA